MTSSWRQPALVTWRRSTAWVTRQRGALTRQRWIILCTLIYRWGDGRATCRRDRLRRDPAATTIHRRPIRDCRRPLATRSGHSTDARWDGTTRCAATVCIPSPTTKPVTTSPQRLVLDRFRYNKSKYVLCCVLNIKKTYQFTLLCKGDQVTHPKQRKSFY